MRTAHTILIADDHPVVLAGLVQYLQRQGFVVAGTADTAAGLIAAAATDSPDIIVTDYSFGGEADGIRMLERLRRTQPGVGLVVFSRVRQIGLIREMLAHGVAAFVSKTAGLECVAEACRKVHTGISYVDPTTGALLRSAFDVTDTTETGSEATAEHNLSPREHEVLRLLGAGMTLRDIADRFRRSPKTISVQKCAAMSKLGLKNDIELALYLARQTEQ